MCTWPGDDTILGKTSLNTCSTSYLGSSVQVPPQGTETDLVRYRNPLSLNWLVVGDSVRSGQQ
jgi:hypothetical protein